MKVQKTVSCRTSDTEEVTAVKEFVGTTMPAGFLINHGVHGYGKFVYDEETLKTLHSGLKNIQDKLDRKHIYYIMYDMIKSGRIAGARVLSIIMNNIVEETAEDVLNFIFKSLLPAIVGKYLPMEEYIPMNSELFESTLKILASGKFKEASTLELLLNTTIGYAHVDKHKDLLYTWFMSDKITDL